MITRFWRTLSVCVLCCALGNLAAAPAPLARAGRVSPVSPGDWVITWDGTECKTILKDDGTLTLRYSGTLYEGSWSYRDGVFFVLETCDPGQPRTWKWWAVKVVWKDGVGLGVTTADSSFPGTKIQLRRSQ